VLSELAVTVNVTTNLEAAVRLHLPPVSLLALIQTTATLIIRVSNATMVVFVKVTITAIPIPSVALSMGCHSVANLMALLFSDVTPMHDEGTIFPTVEAEFASVT
jgi:hypothetical protein